MGDRSASNRAVSRLQRDGRRSCDGVHGLEKVGELVEHADFVLNARPATADTAGLVGEPLRAGDLRPSS